VISAVFVSYFLHQFQVPPDPVIRDHGSLTVEVQEFSDASVPLGAQRVLMLQLQLTADCSGPVDVRSVSLQRRGLGANDDMKGVYIAEGHRRVSSVRPIARRDGSVHVYFRTLSLRACEKKTLMVFANFSSNASITGEHRILLTDIDAGASAVHTLRRETRPSDSRMRTVGVPVGQISVDYLRLTTPVRYGNHRLISRFRLTADNRSDHRVHAISFTNTGTASDADLQNLSIEFRGRDVTTVATHMDGDRVRLAFEPPFLLRKNHTLQFGLRADVRASRKRTIQFVIEEESDIEAVPFFDR